VEIEIWRFVKVMLGIPLMALRMSLSLYRFQRRCTLGEKSLHLIQVVSHSSLSYPNGCEQTSLCVTSDCSGIATAYLCGLPDSAWPWFLCSFCCSDDCRSSIFRRGQHHLDYFSFFCHILSPSKR